MVEVATVATETASTSSVAEGVIQADGLNQVGKETLPDFTENESTAEERLRPLGRIDLPDFGDLKGDGKSDLPDFVLEDGEDRQAFAKDENVYSAKGIDGVSDNERTGSESDEKISYSIHTRNEGLEGDRHPITGVPFERKTVEDADGNEVTGVFPEFDSKFDAQLPEEKLQASDSEQFAECNEQLKAAVENDPELAKQFTSEQLEQIKNGDTPDGYTWHHNEEKGKMQLVDSQTHAQTGHTGGKSIWGGGTENR